MVAAWCLAGLTACAAAPGRPAKVAALPPAAALPTSATTTTVPFTTYTVAAGDTLSAIATRYGVSVQAIANANHLTNLGALAVGQVLRIPADISLALSITPHEGQPGTAFQFLLARVNPSDTVTFSITQPGHAPYTGPQHTPDPARTVRATYQTYPGDPPGTYVVLAHASSGKGAFGSFRIDAPGTSSTAS